MSTSEVKFKDILELTARRQMIFHHLRISAALQAYKKDLHASRQPWWIENLKFELNNALTFVGLCTIRDWNVPVPNLIRLLAEAYSNKTVLSANQVWEELSSDKLDLTNQLHLAWWAHPGGGKGCFTFDELSGAFEHYLQNVPQSMVETEKLGGQRTDFRSNSQRKLLAMDGIASLISSIEDASKKNRKEIQDHQAAIHASAFLSKKYKESGVVPSRSQLESYAAEFNDYMKFADATERLLDGVHDEVAKPAADNLAANHSR